MFSTIVRVPPSAEATDRAAWQLTSAPVGRVSALADGRRSPRRPARERGSEACGVCTLPAASPPRRGARQGLRLDGGAENSDLVEVYLAGYHLAMNTVVNISQLKNRFSHYLRLVRTGQTIVICDRDLVVARIEPAGPSDAVTDDEAALAALERSGTLRRGSQAPLAGWRDRRVSVSADVVAAVAAEREDGR